MMRVLHSISILGLRKSPEKAAKERLQALEKAETAFQRWRVLGGTLKHSRKARKSLEMLYPYLEIGQKGGADGINFMAIVNVLLAVVVLVVWVRSIVRTFQPHESRVIGFATPTVSVDRIVRTLQATMFPTQTPFVVRLNNEKSTSTPLSVALDTVESLPTSTVTPTSVPIVEYQARISYYWPPYGGINCDRDLDGVEECDYMASGQRYEDWVGKGLACPVEFPIGTQFEINGQLWMCVDRGGAIVSLPDGTIWLDLLSPVMPYGWDWGRIETVQLR